MEVTLEKINHGNFEKVISLELHSSQEHYLPSNLYSIAESSLSELYHPRAIVLGGDVVGFLMYQYGEKGAVDENECTIWRFMIDKRHQNRGIGRMAMACCIKEIAENDQCELIDIYYGSQNAFARHLYLSFGFKEVGFRDDGDIIADLRIRN